MRPSIRSRLIALVRAQWAGLLALFLVIAGGTAYAANTVGSGDVIDNSLLSADLKNNAAVRSADVQNEGLTGTDIANQSGVDTCVLGVRIGQLCFRAENDHRPWSQAFGHCANLDLRLPTLGEAMELAQTHDLPDVDEGEFYWTGDRYFIEPDGYFADVVNDSGSVVGFASDTDEQEAETVCVTTPTN